MSKVQILPITVEAAKEVASNLCPDDRREVEEGFEIDPMKHLVWAARNLPCVYFTMPNGKTAGMAGVESDGRVWMLCTPVIEEYPHTFAREARKFIKGRKEKLLWNIVDKRNATHLKLLKFLGFKFLREIKQGPNQLPFIEFCYVLG